MVTTTSTSQDLSFCVYDLWNTEHDEDREVALHARQQMESLVQTIKPILRYIDSPIGEKRAIIVILGDRSSNSLVLTRDGDWGYIDTNGEVQLYDYRWEYHNFARVLEALQGALTTALEKKKEHADALEKRKLLLDNINTLIEAAK